MNPSQKPQRLKADNKFQPLPRDEGDEFYPNGIFEFNVTKLLAFIQSNPDAFLKEEIEVADYRKYSSDHLDESTIKTADLSIPIILAEISPGRFNVIDGNHRLEKAYQNGMGKISAFRVRPKHHMPFLTSEKAYRAYIAYWNSKIDDMER